MQSNRLYLRPVISNEAIETKNYIRLSSQHRPDSKKAYIAKLIPESHLYTPTYYPIFFSETLTKSSLSISTHINSHLSLLNPKIQQIELVEFNRESGLPAETITIEVKHVINRNNKDITITKDKLAKKIQEELSYYPVAQGQMLSINVDQDVTLELNILKINSRDTNNCFFIGAETNFNFKLSPPIAKHLTITTEHLPTAFTLDFKSRGIGGHHKELEQLVRESFYSRALGNEYAKAYGANHTRGILISGPPGTGKTLIAREIARIFTNYGKDNEKVTIINGPELKNRYVGQSEENLRMIFRPAISEWERNGEKSDLYVYIFDEIDALAPKRGSRSGGTGVDDDMVAQLLTILDGVNSPKNILVFGLTNRKDLVDPAVTRPGRLSVLIDVKLPDEQDRLEILTIHTKIMRENRLINESVNLNYWAKETKNYTGAELAELVKKAGQYAMGNNFDFSAGQTSLILKREIKEVEHLQKVTQEHFKLAFKDITPAFGIDKRNFNFDKTNFIPFSHELENIIKDFNSSLTMLQNNKDLKSLTFLIDGASGTGKTALAKYLAQSSEANYIRVVTADKLLGLSLPQQLNFIDEVFSHAQHSQLSVIILDDLENILLADAEQSTYSNPIRLKLEALLKEYNDADNQRIIIATTKNKDFIRKMHLLDLFNENKSLNSIVLNYKLKADIIKLIMAISNTLNVKIIDDLEKTAHGSITISIKDLLYKIKKFTSTVAKNRELSMHEFYQFLKTEPRPRHFDDEIDELRSDVQGLQLNTSSLFKPTFGT